MITVLTKCFILVCNNRFTVKLCMRIFLYYVAPGLVLYLFLYRIMFPDKFKCNRPFLCILVYQNEQRVIRQLNTCSMIRTQTSRHQIEIYLRLE